MRLTFKDVRKLLVPVVALACTAPATFASSIDIIGYNSPEVQKTVVGVWAANDKISIKNKGTYSILLTDFGLASPTAAGFSSSFSYLGAMVSNSYGNIASATFDKNSTNPNYFLSFDADVGDYWLSLFAITDSNTNVGTFNMSLLEGDISPVPLPASFWFMATALLGLVSFFRQSKATQNIAGKS